jgi:hypothetical protein
MATYALTNHFSTFFGRLNPGPTFEQRAARDHARVTKLIEDPSGPARVLAPRCFLQGSYRQDTAIYTINDVDVVALCELWQPGSGSASGTTWDRHAIFDTVASALSAGGLQDRVRYKRDSMVIKVDLDTKIEVLPVVYRAGNYDPTSEPFRLWRPRTEQWEDGFARDHQQWLSAKNKSTGTRFKPAIKVLKHLNSLWEMEAVSFHLECLAYSLRDSGFRGSPADYISEMLSAIAALPVETYDTTRWLTPCGDRDIFTGDEWPRATWRAFHAEITELAEIAVYAATTDDRALAVRCWRAVLGSNFFPAYA